ncbi:MAG: hypothetical protein N2053_12065, partial [Chitinispirillaceae bacterium]|nr:hypothetical protein [Chitinispirillaceae bacterium]
MRKNHTFFIIRKTFLILVVILLSGKIRSSFSAGLPEEFILTERWRLLFSANSPLTNPTFINEENYISLRFAGTSVLGEFLTAEAGLVYPIGLYQAAGFTWLHQGLRKPYIQTYIENGEYKEGGNISDHTEYFMLSYAYNLWAGLTVGANLNVLWKTFVDYSNIGISPDLGLSYRLIHNPLIGTHIFGANIQNAIYIKTIQFEELPRVIRFSLNSTYLERQVESTFDFSLRDIGVSPAQFINSPSKLEWNLDGKIGGWILRFAKIYGLFGITEEAFSYFGFAGGFNIPMVNNGRDLSFLIQYLNILEVEDKSPASFLSLYLKTDIGLHREEVYAKKMAKLANLQPNELYIKALNLYSQGNYWDAFFIFSQLFVEYPDFFKNDWVAFFLGSCQEEMDMRLTAEEAYKKMKEMYPRSAAVPFSDLGLMRIYYRDGNFGAVEEQFNELNKLGVPDSIKYHAYYYMGQTEMKKGNFAKAKQLFEFIPETHPDYVFAQHSAAVCNAA